MESLLLKTEEREMQPSQAGDADATPQTKENDNLSKSSGWESW